jgi:hypothetical protein
MSFVQIPGSFTCLVPLRVLLPPFRADPRCITGFLLFVGSGGRILAVKFFFLESSSAEQFFKASLVARFANWLELVLDISLL